MAKPVTLLAVLFGAAALVASAGVSSARPNTGGGSQADYCRRHCAPIAVASQRASCEAACIRRGGPLDIACLPGADGACGEVRSLRSVRPRPAVRAVPTVVRRRF